MHPGVYRNSPCVRACSFWPIQDNTLFWLQAHNLLTELVRETFRGLESLLSLDLSANQLHKHIGQAFRYTPQLLTLNLVGNALGEEAGRCISTSTVLVPVAAAVQSPPCRTPTRNFTFAPSNRLCIEVVTGIEKDDSGFLNL